MGRSAKTGYLRDVSEEEWSFVLHYLLLSRVDNGKRRLLAVSTVRVWIVMLYV